MLILKYLKCNPSSSSNQLLDILPDPSGLLSEKVPSNAIAAANKEVTIAAEYGTTAAIRFFAKKYPELPLKETTVRR